jgi:hypothetical protein
MAQLMPQLMPTVPRVPQRVVNRCCFVCQATVQALACSWLFRSCQRKDDRSQAISIRAGGGVQFTEVALCSSVALPIEERGHVIAQSCALNVTVITARCRLLFEFFF